MTKQIIFRDDFEGDTLRPEWGIRGVNYVDGMAYARGDTSAVKVEGGQLHLLTVRDTANEEIYGDGVPRYLNGHIGTMGTVMLEPPVWVAARIQFQAFHGSHAALWLQGGYAPDDPATPENEAGIEIDVAEYFGAHNPDRKTGSVVKHNLYWRDADTPAGEYEWRRESTSDRDLLKQGSTPNNWSSKPHTYKAHWAEDEVRFYIDNKVTAILATNGSVLPAFIALSMISRDYEVRDQDHHPLPSEMIVDWVEAWRA